MLQEHHKLPNKVNSTIDSFNGHVVCFRKADQPAALFPVHSSFRFLPLLAKVSEDVTYTGHQLDQRLTFESQKSENEPNKGVGEGTLLYRRNNKQFNEFVIFPY